MIYDKVAEVLLKMDGRRYIECDSSPCLPYDQTPRCEIIRNKDVGRGKCRGNLIIFLCKGRGFGQYFYLCCERHIKYISHRLTEWDGQ